MGACVELLHRVYVRGLQARFGFVYGECAFGTRTFVVEALGKRRYRSIQGQFYKELIWDLFPETGGRGQGFLIQ